MSPQQTKQRVAELNESTWFQFLGRMFQVIGIPIIIGLVIWELGKQDEISTKLTALQTRVDILAADPYHGSDARRDFLFRDAMIKLNAESIKGLNDRIDALEFGSSHRK